VEESKFVVSNEWQDKALRTGVNFCHESLCDFRFVVDHINDFIQQAKVEANSVPVTSRAYPMLSPVDVQSSPRPGYNPEEGEVIRSNVSRPISNISSHSGVEAEVEAPPALHDLRPYTFREEDEDGSGATTPSLDAFARAAIAGGASGTRSERTTRANAVKVAVAHSVTFHG
jgi:hypothetical protein